MVLVNRKYRYYLFAPVIACFVFVGLLISNGGYGNDLEEYSSGINAEYNVVLIVANSLRLDHLGCYGYSVNTSPSINKLAKEGVLFERAIAQSYWTLPSIVSILTSKFVCAHHVDSRNSGLRHNERTLAGILDMHGYKTAAFTCGLDTSTIFGLNKGFTDYDVYSGDKAVGSLTDIMPKVINWLSRQKDHKFFLFLHSYDAHPPYYKDCATTCYDDTYYQGIFKKSLLDYDELRSINSYRRQYRNRQVDLSFQDIGFIMARYDNRIRCLDKEIGVLTDELKRLNIYNNTIIIFCADHGEELGERGTFDRFGNKNLYQEVIHVPLIIRHPDFKAKKRRISSLVQLVDIMPTLLDFLSIPREHQLQGESLVPLIKNGKMDREYVVSEADSQKWAIIRNDGLKLLYSNERSELYNIYKDPSERMNLNISLTGETISLKKKFYIWKQRHEENGRSDNYIQLDPDILEKLRKAGYW